MGTASLQTAAGNVERIRYTRTRRRQRRLLNIHGPSMARALGRTPRADAVDNGEQIRKGQRAQCSALSGHRVER